MHSVDRVAATGAVASGGAHQTVYWHRELPPADAEPIGEHTVEAESRHCSGSLVDGHDLWEECHADLIEQTTRRLEQEIARLGGDCAHVLAESIEPRHNVVASDSWLHGRFDYVLYRRR